MIVKVSGRAIRFFERILGPGISAIAILPFIFIHPQTRVTPELINHEKIHIKQEIEFAVTYLLVLSLLYVAGILGAILTACLIPLCILPFYIWYLIALKRKGYRNISFEQEAYANEHDLNYLKRRKLFAFLWHL